MRRLMCAFAVRIGYKQVFLMTWIIYILVWHWQKKTYRIGHWLHYIYLARIKCITTSFQKWFFTPAVPRRWIFLFLFDSWFSCSVNNRIILLLEETIGLFVRLSVYLCHNARWHKLVVPCDCLLICVFIKPRSFTMNWLQMICSILISDDKS